MYRKSYQRSVLEGKRRRCAAMREAKARLRQERADCAVCVGTVTFDGGVFNGRHVVRLLHAECFDTRRLMLEVDGAACAARSLQGAMRVVCRRMWAGACSAGAPLRGERELNNTMKTGGCDEE